MLDATIVSAHQHSAGAQKKSESDSTIGRSRGGLSTEIHALCDALGNPLAFYLTGGQAHDLQGANVLIAQVHAQALLADKAYDAHERVLQHRVNRSFHPNRIANSHVSMISGFIRRDI